MFKKWIYPAIAGVLIALAFFVYYIVAAQIVGWLVDKIGMLGGYVGLAGMLWLSKHYLRYIHAKLTEQTDIDYPQCRCGEKAKRVATVLIVLPFALLFVLIVALFVIG